MQTAAVVIQMKCTQTQYMYRSNTSSNYVNWCICPRWLYNGKSECLDNSDEENFHIKCAYNKLKDANANASDEEDCPMICAYNEFKYANASKCIHLNMTCDENEYRGKTDVTVQVNVWPILIP